MKCFRLNYLLIIALATMTLLVSCNKPNTTVSATDCVVDNEDICKSLEDEAKKLNADLPKTVGDLTYLSVSTNKRELIHTYGVNTTIEDAASASQMTIEDLKLNQQLMIQKLACENTDIRALLDQKKITITYVYKFTDDTIQFSLTKCAQS